MCGPQLVNDGKESREQHTCKQTEDDPDRAGCAIRLYRISNPVRILDHAERLYFPRGSGDHQA